MTIDLRLEQPCIIVGLIISIFSGRINSVRLEQFSNAYCPIDVIELGNSISSNLVQPENQQIHTSGTLSAALRQIRATDCFWCKGPAHSGSTLLGRWSSVCCQAAPIQHRTPAAHRPTTQSRPPPPTSSAAPCPPQGCRQSWPAHIGNRSHWTTSPQEQWFHWSLKKLALTQP